MHRITDIIAVCAAGLAVAGLLFAALAAGAAQPLNHIVAIVNEEPITLLEVQREARRIRENEPDRAADTVLQTALDDLIDRRLQLQRARLAGIVINDESLQARLAELRQQFDLSSEAALRGLAEERFFMSYEKFRERVREDMQIQALFFREVYSRAQTYEDEVDQFLKNEAGIGNSREYWLRHILVTVDASGEDIDEARELAATLRARAVAGEDFAALARRFSEDGSASAGGNLGYMSERSLPDAFIGVVQNLSAGEISEVIPTARGFHLLKLEEARGGDLRESVRQIRLSHIFFAEESGDLARQVRGQIASEGDFLRAVREHSIDNVSIERDGDIGWFEEQDIPAYFAAALEQMKKGDISPPVPSPFGWHVLFLKDEKTEAFDIQRLREQARQVLREQRALAQREVWLRRLRGAAHVRILDPSFSDSAR